jgi:BA14K-like protein
MADKEQWMDASLPPRGRHGPTLRSSVGTKRRKSMRSTILGLAALGLGTVVLAGSAFAQDYYVGDRQAKTGQIPPNAAQTAPSQPVIGRTANDGGYLNAQPKSQTAQNQPTRERQNAWEGDDRAYGGTYQPGHYYNSSSGFGFGFGAPAAEPMAQGDVASCQARFRSFDPASGTYLGFDGMRHPCP